MGVVPREHTVQHVAISAIINIIAVADLLLLFFYNYALSLVFRAA